MTLISSNLLDSGINKENGVKKGPSIQWQIQTGQG